MSEDEAIAVVGDLADLADAYHQGGREAERAAIVNWLRSSRASYTSRRLVANAIERGDHLTSTKGGE